MEKTSRLHRDKRRQIAAPAYYSRKFARHDGGGDLRPGTVRDFSETGVCMFTSTPLKSGDEITVLCRDIWDESRSGTVIWCNTLDLGAYRVGVALK